MDLRRKKVRLTEEDIVAMLRLPEGTRILAVQGRFDPPSVEVLLQRDDWPAAPPDSEAPLAEKFSQVIDDRLLVWLPELVRDGEPAVPQLCTEYQYKPPGEADWATIDRKSDVVQWLSSHGGKARMRLVGDWDEFPSVADYRAGSAGSE